MAPVVDLSARALVVAGVSVFANLRNVFDEADTVSRRPWVVPLTK